MTDAKKKLAEHCEVVAQALGFMSPKEKARQKLSEHLEDVARVIGEIEQGFETIERGEMNQGDWKIFALALFEFVSGADIYAVDLFDEAGEFDGMTVESFVDMRSEALDQTHRALMSIS